MEKKTQFMLSLTYYAYGQFCLDKYKLWATVNMCISKRNILNSFIIKLFCFSENVEQNFFYKKLQNNIPVHAPKWLKAIWYHFFEHRGLIH